MTTKFMDSVKENDTSNYKKSDYFKFQEGKNTILVLTEPVHFRQAFNVGIVYHGCDYNDIASSKYLTYVKDMKDGQIKLMEMSHTIAKSVVALGEGARTKFDTFPMPYVLEITATGAGKATVKYTIVAGVDETLTKEEVEELSLLDDCEDIIMRKQKWQKDQMETDNEYIAKAKSAIESARAAKQANSKKEEDLPVIEYPEDVELDDIDLETLASE